MHYIKKSFRSRAFRRASFVFILAYLTLFVAGGAAIYTVLKKSEENIAMLGIILGLTLLIWILVFIISGTCRCQLCQATTMRSLKCTHHRNAKRLLGSYRLRVSTSILFTGTFRCPYCGEPFSLKREPPRKAPLSTPPQRLAPSRRAGQIPGKRGF